MSSDIAFVICTERGPLEGMSLLLAMSLRRYGGRFASAPIFSFAPRKGRDISDATRKEFDRLGVEHRHMTLNTEFDDYPLANKPFVCAYAERNVNSDILIFLDSDKLIVNEPSKLFLDNGYDVAVRPVDTRNIGISVEEGENALEYEYWTAILKCAGVANSPVVETSTDGQTILGYWNSGLIATRRDAGVFSAWARNFEKIMRDGLMPSSGRFFIEQSSFAATVMGCGVRYENLPPAYNYPLHLHHKMRESERIDSLDDMVSIHYHKLFRDAIWEFPLSCVAAHSEKNAWLRKAASRAGVFPATPHRLYRALPRVRRKLKRSLPF